jgi:hypothetical protein
MDFAPGGVSDPNCDLVISANRAGPARIAGRPISIPDR